ncbi:class I SAM-dependent methyltransferase [Bacillus sp. JJ1764]|uniref:class I SAM-dependent methyltransferase n=1 Tax=Bacillus sp. JJ1764 TaxID=3122964 RepID=UPI002FFFD356
MENIDFGQVIKNYASSREDIPTAMMDSLMIRGISFEGKKVVDLGSGTGTLARKIAMRKANVVGVEPSSDMLRQAHQLNTTRNFTIPYTQATAENTGLDDSTYDIVTVMRAWNLFDREKALQEIKRLLKSKGILIVIESGFTPDSEVVNKTLTVLNRDKEGGKKSFSNQFINGFPVEWFAEWQHNGFELRDFYKLKDSITLTKEEWMEVFMVTDMDGTQRNGLFDEIFSGISDKESFEIPYECNLCILTLA